MDGDGNAQERGLLDEFESSQCFELDLANHVQWRYVPQEVTCPLEHSVLCPGKSLAVVRGPHYWASESGSSPASK